MVLTGRGLLGRPGLGVQVEQLVLDHVPARRLPYPRQTVVPLLNVAAGLLVAGLVFVTGPQAGYAAVVVATGLAVAVLSVPRDPVSEKYGGREPTHPVTSGDLLLALCLGLVTAGPRGP